MAKKDRPVTQVTTGKVRFSYLHVFEPYAFDSNPGKAQYQVRVLIDKSDKETLAKVQRAINAAKAEGVTKRWKGKTPADLWIPLRDGDEEFPEDESHVGKYFLNAKSTRKPGVVDRNLQTILDPEEVYSGCYGRVSLSFFPFSKSGSNGIGVGLNNVQFLHDGERLSGRRSAEEDFDDDFQDEDQEDFYDESLF